MTQSHRRLPTPVPLTVKLRLTSANSGRPVAGHEVSLWQCDGDCRPAGARTARRCVQVSDAAGWVAFTGVFPAAAAGRWPHVHFAVHSTADGTPLAAQLALPADVCRQVYATAGHESSRKNLSRSSLATDNVLRDGWSLAMASVTGDVQRGFTATRTVGVLAATRTVGV